MFSNMAQGHIPLSWTCHICGRERPDADIAVHQTDMSGLRGFPPGTVLHNVRYCVDSPECAAKAESYSHFDKEPN